MSNRGPVHLAVDGSGLSEQGSGIGIYTSQVVQAMARERPQSRLTVHGSTSGLDRHLLWPVRLRRAGADLFFGCAGQLPLCGVGMRSVITVHDLAIFRRPDWFPGNQWFSVHVVVPTSVRRADAVIAVSTRTATDLVELFDVCSDHVHVVPLAADESYRPLSAEQTAGTRHRLDLPERFVLFLSTIEPRKNLTTLVDAWQCLRNRPPLVIAGRWGWRTEAIRERLARAGSGVHVVGRVDQEDMPGLYNLATCLAHPAWYEGFGLTPLEAMACGTPAVVSSAASLPEVVGDAALLVDPGDVDGWTQSLERVLEDESLRARLRESGLRRAAELTWQRTARLTWEVVDRVISSAPALP